MDCSLPGSSVHGLDSTSSNTGVGCHALLQRIFPTQELNPGLPHFRWILYCLSHQRSQNILEWVTYSFSRGSSWPGNWTRVFLHCRQILYQLSYQGSLVLVFPNFYWMKCISLLSPVVMYGCESWTIKRAEHRRIDAFELRCWRRLLGVPWTARRSNQSILREISPEYSGRTDVEAETPILWPTDAKSWLI